MKSQQFPVIYCQHIYFPCSTQNRTLFIQNPHKYISQVPPGHSVPITLAIVGPPKSGKTTGMLCCMSIETYTHSAFHFIVAKKFCEEYGCIRLSIGEVLRRTISKFPHSKLSQLIESHLKSGQTVPEDLCIYALESALLEAQCSSRGYVECQFFLCSALLENEKQAHWTSYLPLVFVGLLCACILSWIICLD